MNLAPTVRWRAQELRCYVMAVSRLGMLDGDHFVDSIAAPPCIGRLPARIWPTPSYKHTVPDKSGAFRMDVDGQVIAHVRHLSLWYRWNILSEDFDHGVWTTFGTPGFLERVRIFFRARKTMTFGEWRSSYHPYKACHIKYDHRMRLQPVRPEEYYFDRFYSIVNWILILVVMTSSGWLIWNAI